MNIGDQITVRIGVWRGRPIGVIGMNVGDIGDGRELRHEQKACNHSKRGQDGCLTSSHELTLGKASASLSFHLAKIAYEGDGTMFIQIVVPIGGFLRKTITFRPPLSVHSSPFRAGVPLFT